MSKLWSISKALLLVILYQGKTLSWVTTINTRLNEIQQDYLRHEAAVRSFSPNYSLICHRNIWGIGCKRFMAHMTLINSCRVNLCTQMADLGLSKAYYISKLVAFVIMCFLETVAVFSVSVLCQCVRSGLMKCGQVQLTFWRVEMYYTTSFLV